jgi:hypothetical protein
MAVLPASSGVSGRAKHADMPASARASRATRHGGEAAPCRATPTCRLAFDAAQVPRPFVLPSAFAPRWRSGQRRPGGAAARAASAPANAATAAGRARSRQDACTLDGCAGGSAKCNANAPALHARRHGDGQPERHARWHDEMHGNVQRIGGHHGRDSSQTGCATPITADALTGPKYRLSNDAGLVTLNRNSSPGRSGGTAARMAAAGPAGRQAARRPPARRRSDQRIERCTRVAARPRPRV